MLLCFRNMTTSSVIRDKRPCSWLSGGRQPLFADMCLMALGNVPVPCHRVVLAASSPYLETLLQNTTDESDSIYYVGVPDFCAKDIEAVLSLVYTGRMTVTRSQICQTSKLIELLNIQVTVGEQLSKLSAVVQDEKQNDESKNTTGKTSHWESSYDRAVKRDRHKFRCETCGRGYPWLSLLRNHEKSHEARPRVSCPLCNKQLSNKNSVRKHLFNKHPDQTHTLNKIHRYINK